MLTLDEHEEEQEIKFDPLEIATCQWVPLDEWVNSPDKHPVPITLYLAKMAIDVLDGREQLLKSERIEIKSQGPEYPPWDIMMYRKKYNGEE